ncbi:ribokinase [Fodinicurvata halophila]|uniref:Ribokinase n=1 Tax=Fodinicurvata halophila TaxID=1419723 RepID=A0ABV8UHH4_9PROT
MSDKYITILGAFFVDLACRTLRMPEWGETLHGTGFSMGPGGKGSNQAVAAARQNAKVELITRVAQDTFGEMARRVYEDEGIGAGHVSNDPDAPSGTATIIVDDARGENAIVIVPGACGNLNRSDVDAASNTIASSTLFVSQLELSTDACLYGIELAYRHGVPVVLNPAPAVELPREVFSQIDYLTPNMSEASLLVGREVRTREQVASAAATLREWGVRHVLITLGEEGVYVSSENQERVIPAVNAGHVLDTTGAGDAFNGGLVAALAEGLPLMDAAHFGCAVAGLSVTKRGTAPSMPSREEVESLLERAG